MPTVGDRIRTRRTELGWTQDQLARKAGISKSFLSDVENGRRSVSAENLFEIAQALNVSLDHLMKGKSSGEERRPAVEIPVALAAFAEREGLSFRQAVTLLEMQQQIVAHRSTIKKDNLKSVDWQKFYEAVKEFL